MIRTDGGRARSGRLLEPGPVGTAFGAGPEWAASGQKKRHALACPGREKTGAQFPVLSLILDLPAGQIASGINVDA